MAQKLSCLRHGCLFRFFFVILIELVFVLIHVFGLETTRIRSLSNIFVFEHLNTYSFAFAVVHLFDFVHMWSLTVVHLCFQYEFSHQFEKSKITRDFSHLKQFCTIISCTTVMYGKVVFLFNCLLIISPAHSVYSLYFPKYSLRLKTLEKQGFPCPILLEVLWWILAIMNAV